MGILRNKLVATALAAAVLVPTPSLAAKAAETGKTAPEPDSLHQWAHWRGPLGTGVAPHGDPPVRWRENQNVRWKTAIPGKGLSSPVVWGDRLFVTSAIPHGEPSGVAYKDADGAHDNVSPDHSQKFVVLALDRHDGRILWQTTVREVRPHEGTHETGSWASASAATDGDHVFASFGSHGIYALDLEGKVVWEVDLGDMQTKHGHGEGSSPTLFDGTLIVNWDHESDSFITALDKKNGKQRWKTARDDGTSWSTPMIVEHDGKSQVVVSATKRVRSYDPTDGTLLWETAGLSRNVVATPVAADGLVYVTSSYDFQAMLAIRLDQAKGNITGSEAIRWKLDRYTPYVSSPLLYGDTLFFMRHNQGLVSAVDRRTGSPLFGPERLAGIRNVFASPVGAADRIYVIDRGGMAIVFERAPRFKQLALNRLDDSFSASPAIVGDALYLRGDEHVYCLAEDPKD